MEWAFGKTRGNRSMLRMSPVIDLSTDLPKAREDRSVIKTAHSVRPRVFLKDLVASPAIVRSEASHLDVHPVASPVADFVEAEAASVAPAVAVSPVGAEAFAVAAAAVGNESERRRWFYLLRAGEEQHS